MLESMLPTEEWKRDSQGMRKRTSETQNRNKNKCSETITNVNRKAETSTIGDNDIKHCLDKDLAKMEALK